MSYKIAFTPQAWEDFNFWKETSPKTAEKIKAMLRELPEQENRNPFTRVNQTAKMPIQKEPTIENQLVGSF